MNQQWYYYSFASSNWHASRRKFWWSYGGGGGGGCMMLILYILYYYEWFVSRKSFLESSEQFKASIILKTKYRMNEFNQSHFCINPEFSPSFTTSIWTVFPETMDDLQSILVLGTSLSNISQAFDLVLFGTKHVSEEEWIRLNTVWSHYCQLEQNISRILQYSLWGMTVYDRIMYISPHSMVLNERKLFEMLTLPLPASESSSNELPFLGLWDYQLWMFQPHEDEFHRLSSESRHLDEIYHNHSADLSTVVMLAVTYDDSLIHLERQNQTNSTVPPETTIPSVTTMNISTTYSVIYWKKELPPWQMCIQQRGGYHKYNQTYSCQLWIQLYDQIYAKQSMPCLNLDFISNHTHHQQQLESQHVAVVTMNTGDLTQISDFVDAAIMLGVSIRQHTSPTIALDMIHMELASQPIPLGYWKMLEHVGWKRCVVDRIPPPESREPSPRYKDQFTKLHVWRMTQYRSVLYLDSDCWVLGPIDQLLLGQISFQGNNGTKLAVARDFIMDKTRNGWVDTFNMGVFLIKPQKLEFDRLIQLRDSNMIAYEVELSEQGWLNVIYERQWDELPSMFNANILAIRAGAISSSDDIRILHFTSPKMFNPCIKRQFRKIRHYCDSWKVSLAISKANYSLHSSFSTTKANDSLHSSLSP